MSTFLCKVFQGYFSLLIVEMIHYHINDPFNTRRVIETTH